MTAGSIAPGRQALAFGDVPTFSRGPFWVSGLVMMFASPPLDIGESFHHFHRYSGLRRGVRHLVGAVTVDCGDHVFCSRVARAFWSR